MNKSINVLAPWIFVTAVYLGSMATGGIEFFGIILLFLFGLIGSSAMASLTQDGFLTKVVTDSASGEYGGNETEIVKELQNIKKRLDSLNQDIEGIKKVIEE
ncbi:MAG: hypothetical protein GTO02_08935 [Candidatus Dadabacteria bacterium]|nr:hypothetical protein [Candidatus Dadabacteria bacterium]